MYTKNHYLCFEEEHTFLRESFCSTPMNQHPLSKAVIKPFNSSLPNDRLYDDIK